MVTCMHNSCMQRCNSSLTVQPCLPLNWPSTLRSKYFCHRKKRVSCYVSKRRLFSTYGGSICFVLYFANSNTVHISKSMVITRAFLYSQNFPIFNFPFFMIPPLSIYKLFSRGFDKGSCSRCDSDTVFNLLMCQIIALS